MKIEKFPQGDFVCSVYSGYNYYYPRTDGDKVYALHAKSGQEAIIKYDSSIKFPDLKKWQEYINCPVNAENFIWPSDIILNKDGVYGFVFYNTDRKNYKTFRDILYSEALLDWRRPEISELIKNTLKLFDEIHRAGYVYNAFDIKDMLYSEKDMSVLFGFTTAITRHGGDAYKLSRVEKSLRGIEFLPVRLNIDTDSRLCLADDLNSLAALIFRLMTGRMPYQGKLIYGEANIMDKLTDTDIIEHVSMFLKYRKRPVFIFDPDDDSNCIGLFDSEKKFTERYEALPQKLKDMFCEVLCKDNALAPYDRQKFYSAGQWLEAFDEACGGTDK